ncbi:glutathione S-transferase 1-like [Scaptodrosophila lebanonensis]|uniref:Glutathione S-transferase 1-like n=1 Tax=Drosophila lebanonensis TaxID=7225 RepID=A0A6J2UFG6_DROLE|nr:glutathione S-transferase 1-like [Scaptodrosophila lebanonensis]
MTKVTLYGLDASPPVRAVLMTLKALDLNYDYVLVNILAGEHLAPHYIEKNPQHTVPTLEDNGHFLWDSHAIMPYLVDKYAKNGALYPKDAYQRAIVNQRLHFDSGMMFIGALRNIVRPLLFMNETEIPQSRINALDEVYGFVETFLAENDYVAGMELTIADFSFVSTLTSLETFLEIDASKYGKLTAWLERMKQLPYYDEANGSGVAQFSGLMRSKNFTIVP